jgi:hypothetical protein
MSATPHAASRYHSVNVDDIADMTVTGQSAGRIAGTSQPVNPRNAHEIEAGNGNPGYSGISFESRAEEENGDRDWRPNPSPPYSLRTALEAGYLFVQAPHHA